jgi:hypothetical protein
MKPSRRGFLKGIIIGPAIAKEIISCGKDSKPMEKVDVSNPVIGDNALQDLSPSSGRNTGIGYKAMTGIPFAATSCFISSSSVEVPFHISRYQ